MGKRCTLYRAFGHDGTLLYIGIAAHWPRRLLEHERKEWFLHTERVELSHYETRTEALAAESQAIATEHPVHNRTGGNRPRQQNSDIKHLSHEERIKFIQETFPRFNDELSQRRAAENAETDALTDLIQKAFTKQQP